MRRWTLNILAGLSLIIFLTTVIFWVRSYWRADTLRWHFESSDVDVYKGTGAQFSSECGTLFVWARASSLTPMPPNHWEKVSFLPNDWSMASGAATRRQKLSEPYFGFSGFAGKLQWREKYSSISRDLSYSSIALIIPHWSIALLSAILPAWRFGGRKRRLRRYRLAHNLCLKCGYDLRASPERCPECGELNREGAKAANEKPITADARG